MVYDWDVHQETCYQLYIEEGRSLEDIMEHMKSAYKFSPSKRAFQTQFRRWNFPSKQRPAYKNDRLVSRIKELWEKNLAQREMLRVLNEEDGFDIKPRELMRVRTRNRWLLRVPNGDKPRPAEPEDEMESLEDASSALLDDDDATLSLQTEEDASIQPLHQSLSVPTPESQPDLITDFPISPERHEKKKRKRNRVTTDASGAITRFPSEMTIDEARLILNLDQPTYRTLRTTFQQICQESNVVKKTVAGPEKWEASKSSLIGEIPELQGALWVSKENTEPKKLALDVICTDVTKRMRTMETRMTLAEAKNALGINPQESREIRLAFHQVLADAKYTCKSDATPQQWEDLKRRWGQQSKLIKKILDTSQSDPDAELKTRALEVLARDVMKRLRDERVRKDPKKHQQLHHPPPANLPIHGGHHDGSDKLSHTPSTPPTSDQIDLGGMTPRTFDGMSEVSHPSHITFSPASSAMASHISLSLQSQASSMSDSRDAIPPPPPRVLESSMPPGMQLTSHMGSSLLLGGGSDATFLDPPYVPQQYAPPPAATQVYHHQCPPVPTVYAVYFRLHPSSTIMPGTTIWIAMINSHSLQELRQVAAEKFHGTMCARVEGVVKDGNGGELPLPIEQDQELAAYLGHLQGAAPAFNVQLVWKTP